MKWYALVFCLPLFVLACGVEQELPSSARQAVSPAPSIRTTRRGMRLLPKAMTLEERLFSFKYRMNQPQLLTTYARAPKGNIRVPAEYEPMEGVLVRVANDETMDGFFGNLVKGILQAGVTPYLVYYDATDKSEILQYALSPKGIRSNQVKWIQSGIDAFWARDYGPWHVYVDGKRSIVDTKYYPSRAYDDAIAVKLGSIWGDHVFKAPIFVEGGNFMTDGKGTCWTSTGFFAYNSLSREQLASLYKAYLGCKKLYTPPPLYQEGTTHLDMFSKLLNDKVIMVAYSQASWGASTAEIKSLDDAATYYDTNTNAKGEAFKVIRIPMVFKNGSEGRVYYAYTNSTIVNKTVLVPMYGLPQDADALKVYKDNMPGYNVVGVQGGESVIPWGGSVHCTTMQIPTATTKDSDGVGSLVTVTKEVSLDKDQWKLYGPYKAASGDLKVSLAGTGDADLYVWKNKTTNTMNADNVACSPYLEGSFEDCTVDGPGTFYVGVHSPLAVSLVSLSISYNKP